MIIYLQGETPPKKNSRINTRSGKSFPNPRFTKWHKEALEQIIAQGVKSIDAESQVKLTVTFYHGDLVRRDSDNQLSSILDTLVDAKVLIDDNWKVIPRKEIIDKYDKGKARCEIKIEVLKE